ncbi:MAG: hypothetical protein OEZ47_14915, partial [Gammaproteobacteria bacterium]|nr:hypothetical protein [Gammaproteobacteria bacterium]
SLLSTFNIGIVYYHANDITITLTLVPSEFHRRYSSALTQITASGNAVERGTPMAKNVDDFTADITNTALFANSMQNIADAAGGAASWYSLFKKSVSSTLLVEINLY